MARIFVSYRREDSIAYAGRLSDYLTARFGKDQVFMDIDTLKPGEDFVDVLQSTVSSCDVLIAVIGKQWLTAVDENGKPRLQTPDDFVRLEIATALERDVRVIPALVGGASMPRDTELPEALKRLARRHAIQLPDIGWSQSVASLIDTLETVVTPAPVPPPQMPQQELRPHVVKAQVPPGACLDPDTGLMWTMTDNGRDVNWHEASEYAKQLRLGNYSDWRLPTIQELKRLPTYIFGNFGNPGNPTKGSAHFWSSTKEDWDSAFCYSFQYGVSHSSSLTYSGNLRALCVRGLGNDSGQS